eukprot:Platyproteum_vivax@DN3611_c0_g1_i1.p1
MSLDLKDWRLWAVVGGGALALAGVAWWVLRDEPVLETEDDKSKTTKKINPKTATADEVYQILKQLNYCQEQVKAAMKKITAELQEKEHTFDEVYQMVAAKQPEDALEKHNLTMQEFDEMMERHSDNHNVREQITQIMGPLPPMIVTGEVPPKVQAVTRKTIMDVHTFMLEELDKLVAIFKKLPNRSKYQMKTVTIAAQAIVGAKVEKEFGLQSDDMEAAVWLRQSELASDYDFAQVNLKMQSRMQVFMTGD